MRRPSLFVFSLAAFACAAALAAEGPRVIPGTVFVGDRATLLAPLAGFPPGRGDVEAEALPYAPNVDIHRVAVERRTGGARLAVEFTPFAPGVLELPPFEVGGEVFEGLYVVVASVLGPSEPPILSPHALPLAVPGTALLVYGTIGAIALFLLLASMASLRGPGWLRGRLAAWRRARSLRAMLGTERRLRKALSKGAKPREALDALSGEFRGFLAGLSGENCRAMTAAEMGRIRLGDGEGAAGDGFPAGFFDRCDRMRFGGRAIGGDEAVAAMDDLRGFLLLLARAPEEGRGRAKPARGGAA